MTKLFHVDFEHTISFDDGSSTVLVLEDTKQFRKYIAELYSSFDGDGPFHLVDGIKEKKFKDHLEIILSPFSVSFSEKRLTTKLQALMKEHMASENHYVDTSSIISAIDLYAEKLSSDFIVDIECESVDLAGLIKIIGFSVRTEYENDFEKVLEYMNVLHDSCGIDDFVLVSFFSYFSMEEINHLVSDTSANKHNLLFLESIQPPSVPIDSKLIIVDKDGCEIF